MWRLRRVGVHLSACFFRGGSRNAEVQQFPRSLSRPDGLNKRGQMRKGVRSSQQRKARQRQLKYELGDLRERLKSLGPEVPGEPRATQRQREVARRQKMRVLMELDRLENAGVGNLKNKPGSPRGVTYVVQGGSPGSGKRS